MRRAPRQTAAGLFIDTPEAYIIPRVRDIIPRQGISSAPDGADIIRAGTARYFVCSLTHSRRLS